MYLLVRETYTQHFSLWCDPDPASPDATTPPFVLSVSLLFSKALTNVDHEMKMKRGFHLEETIHNFEFEYYSYFCHDEIYHGKH